MKGANSSFRSLHQSCPLIFFVFPLNQNKIERLRVTNNPKGLLTPIPDLKPDQKELKDFFWYDYLRPQSKEDIYVVKRKRVQDAPKRSNKFRHE